MTITIKDFSQLTTQELYEALRLRAQVFVVEQDCVYQDLDGKDQLAYHVMGRTGDRLVAYTRIFAPGHYCKDASIGRVVVAPEARGRNYGKAIMKASIQGLEARFGPLPIHISAQTHLQGFYSELGFVAEGDGYLEDGIPHIAMVRPKME